jgi:hypothetical protein
MNNQTFYFYAHPLQKRRFFLALIFATVLFPLVALALIAGTLVLIVPIFALLLWVSMRVFFARMIGNSIQVSEFNYPRIQAISEELKVKMGYQKPVYIFVFEQGSFNAYLSMLFFRRAIFLTSEILETGVSDDEVRWLVGRFIGYMRARRQAGVLGWIIRAAQKLLIFNVFMLPYERALVYTGDRLAVAAIGGDISSAASAMQKLLVGRQMGYSVNPEGIIAQQRQIKGTFFGFLARMVSAFPHTTARYVDLIHFAKRYFPAQFARFAAANPGLPEDFSPMLSGPEPAVVTPPREGARPDSGLSVGWVLVAIILVVSVGGVFERLKEIALASAAHFEAGTAADADTAQMSVAAQAGGAVAALANQASPQATADAEQLPDHVHRGADGNLEPDAGCQWASNDPKDFRVVCDRSGANSANLQ